MGGQNRLSLEFQHHDHRDQHRPASSSMWIQFEGGGQVGRTWHSRLECSYSRICSGSIPRKLKTRNKQLPRTPNRDCSYASSWTVLWQDLLACGFYLRRGDEWAGHGIPGWNFPALFCCRLLISTLTTTHQECSYLIAGPCFLLIL